MFRSKYERACYEEIQKKLFYLIPEKWDSVFLYASMVDSGPKKVNGEMYFYYFPKGLIKKKVVNAYEIPSLFNIDEDKYYDLINSLYRTTRHFLSNCSIIAFFNKLFMRNSIYIFFS